LLGQTYHSDNLEVNGRQDDYSRLDDGSPAAVRTGVGGVVATRTNGKGAIEGILEDYEMATGFATAFRFSRFDATSAPVRNVSGKVGLRHVHSHPSRE
jgi:hypothetical protein